MNPFDPGGALLLAQEQMESRQRAAAYQRMVRCCRQVISVSARLLAIRSLVNRRRASPTCAAC